MKNFISHEQPLKPHVIKTKALNDTLNLMKNEEKKQNKTMKKINDLGKFMIEEL